MRSSFAVVLSLLVVGTTDDVRAQEADAPLRGVSVELSLAYYEVSEPTLSKVIDRLNSTRLEGPDAPPSQGLTEYRIAPNWQPVAGGGVCRADDVTVSIRVDITLPTWPHVDGRPQAEQSGWQTIESAIREHEFVHRDLTVAAGIRLLNQLQGIEARGCGTLRQVVDSRISIEDDRLREQHTELDRSTPPRLSIGR